MPNFHGAVPASKPPFCIKLAEDSAFVCGNPLKASKATIVAINNAFFIAILSTSGSPEVQETKTHTISLSEYVFDKKTQDSQSAKSAGVSFGTTVPQTVELMDGVDVIIVMEYKHHKATLKIAPSCWKKIEVLRIPDKYYRG